MAVRRMIFTAGKESFIVRVLLKKLQDTDIICDFVPFRVNEINDYLENIPVTAIYIDDDVKNRLDVLHFLIDNAEEKNAQFILIGERDDVDDICDHVPEDLIYKSFVRPVDNDEFAEDIKEFFDKAELGALKKSILVIDDDPQYLNMVRQWLSGTYKVSLASSGMQGIKFLSKSKVDLILLDHEMPVTSGPQVLEMLRSEEETKDIPVMFLTGKGDKKSVMAVVALHPEGYFLKTISKNDLLKELKKYFDEHSVNS